MTSNGPPGRTLTVGDIEGVAEVELFFLVDAVSQADLILLYDAFLQHDNAC